MPAENKAKPVSANAIMRKQKLVFMELVSPFSYRLGSWQSAVQKSRIFPIALGKPGTGLAGTVRKAKDLPGGGSGQVFRRKDFGGRHAAAGSFSGRGGL
jgi:hypothetical protein